jgi:ABC-type uncharacterized transport system substrate-binding protein
VERLPPQVELLKEAIPQAARVAVLWNPVNPWHPLALKAAESAARSLVVQLHGVEVTSCRGAGGRLHGDDESAGDAILVLSDPMTFFHRARIADLAAKRRLPTMHGVRGYVDAGGLISYWANQADLYRRGASYVDRILKGAKPGGLTHRAAERDSS